MNGGHTPHGWKIVLSIFGFPVLADESRKDFPHVTAAFLVGCLITAFLAGFNSANATLYGFLPDEWDRLYGFTFLSSVFLHASLFHFLSNAYFMLIFGSRVEQHMGKLRYSILLLVALILSHLFHAALTSDPSTPSIGGSGMIAGTLGYYSIHFASERVGIFLVFRWFWPRAWIFLGAWLLIQITGVLSQIGGPSNDNVNYLSHFGGFLSGLMLGTAWLPVLLQTRNRGRR